MSTVLIMEPDPALGDMLQAVLTSAGHTALVTPTTGLALDCLARLQVDVIVTELTETPSRDGAWDPVAALGDSAPTTPIVVFTAQAVDKQTPPAQPRVDAVLRKPLDLDDLARCIEQMTNGTRRDKSRESR